jgi:glycosyltransferase involved in cell wall biosynthesis
MKVLFLNYEYPPLGGGAGIATEALLREFARFPDVQVHLVTSAVEDVPDHQRLGDSVFIHRVRIGKNSDRLHSQSLREIIAYAWKAWRFLGPFVRSQQTPFDVTLAFFTVPCACIAYGLKCLYRLPYVVALRGADVPGFSEKYSHFYPFMKPIVRFLWRKAERVIPNSPGLEILARETAPGQMMSVIENGVDITSFAPAERTDHGDGSSVVFLTVARLTKRKGLDRLIRAFAPLARETSVPSRLLIAGDGEEDAALRALARDLGIADRVEFLGRVDHARFALYGEADVFVLPSRNEGMSNSALEALASGLPMVVSRTGGMAELVTDGVNGFLVDAEDMAAFTTALSRLAESKARREAFGAMSRRRAEDKTWQSVAQRFGAVLEEAAARRA